MNMEPTKKSWRERAGQLRVEIYALYLACRHPGVPWYAKAFAALVVGYAFSPIDLIPDFIPVLGYLDDLLLVPLGVKLALKMIPGPVLEECREKAKDLLCQDRPRNWLAAGLILALWVFLLLWVVGGVVKSCGR